jgi:hypothetical protein
MSRETITSVISDLNIIAEQLSGDRRCKMLAGMLDCLSAGLREAANTLRELARLRYHWGEVYAFRFADGNISPRPGSAIGSN